MSTSATQQVRFFGRLFIFISILNHENIFDKSCQLPKKSSSDNLSVKYQLLKIVPCLHNANSPLSIFICQCSCSFLAIGIFSKNCSPISISFSSVQGHLILAPIAHLCSRFPQLSTITTCIWQSATVALKSSTVVESQTIVTAAYKRNHHGSYHLIAMELVLRKS